MFPGDAVTAFRLATKNILNSPSIMLGEKDNVIIICGRCGDTMDYNDPLSAQMVHDIVFDEIFKEE